MSWLPAARNTRQNPSGLDLPSEFTIPDHLTWDMTKFLGIAVPVPSEGVKTTVAVRAAPVFGIYGYRYATIRSHGWYRSPSRCPSERIGGSIASGKRYRYQLVCPQLDGRLDRD